MGLRDFTVPAEFPLVEGKIAFVAEAPGEHECAQGRPLVGYSGQEFNRMIRDAGIIRSECYVGNLFDFRLPGNKVEMISGPKKQMPKGYSKPPVAPGHYLFPEYLDCLDRLREELEKVKPNIIVPMGNTALWAVCGVTGIGKIRGTITESTLLPGTKVLATVHPANILRPWDNRVVSVADFIKAKIESEYPEIRRPRRELWLEPELKADRRIHLR